MYDNDRLLKDLQLNQAQNPQHAHQDQDQQPKPFRRLRKLSAFILAFFAVFFVFFYLKGSISDQSTMSWLNKIPIIGQIKHFVESSTSPLKGEDRGRINILLLGIGGKGHDGGELTDTIMATSLDLGAKKAAMVSIPRDLVVPLDNTLGWRKINNVNAYAERSQPGSGGQAASQAVSTILEAPMDYYVKVDFAGFVKIVDELGGVNVCVDRTFDDYTYPATGQEANPDYYSRFEHLHFDAGCQTMDGSTALKYARSRHAYGPEGTDFARAARQQKVISAIKDKALSRETIFSPKKILNIITDLSEHIQTNLTLVEMTKLWGLTKDIQSADITNRVLDNSPAGLLMDSVGEDGAYTLVPRAGNFSELQYLYANIFQSAPVDTKAKVGEERARIQILNGTWINGLASRTAIDLEKYGFVVVGTANCSKQDYEKSVIYDLTFGNKKESLKLLKEKTDANVSFTLPDWLKEELARGTGSSTAKLQPDLILIVGQDLDKK
jgi:LCP family protein required for cell wall assembly